VDMSDLLVEKRENGKKGPCRVLFRQDPKLYYFVDQEPSMAVTTWSRVCDPDTSAVNSCQ
jgi:hypothetical protein